MEHIRNFVTIGGKYMVAMAGSATPAIDHLNVDMHPDSFQITIPNVDRADITTFG